MVNIRLFFVCERLFFVCEPLIRTLALPGAGGAASHASFPGFFHEMAKDPTKFPTPFRAIMSVLVVLEDQAGAKELIDRHLTQHLARCARPNFSGNFAAACDRNPELARVVAGECARGLRAIHEVQESRKYVIFGRRALGGDRFPSWREYFAEKKRAGETGDILIEYLRDWRDGSSGPSSPSDQDVGEFFPALVYFIAQCFPSSYEVSADS